LIGLSQEGVIPRFLMRVQRGEALTQRLIDFLAKGFHAVIKTLNLILEVRKTYGDGKVNIRRCAGHLSNLLEDDVCGGADEEEEEKRKKKRKERKGFHFFRFLSDGK
jgi:hypothetical protein